MLVVKDANVGVDSQTSAFLILGGYTTVLTSGGGSSGYPMYSATNVEINAFYQNYSTNFIAPKARWRASKGSAPVNRFTRAIKNNTTDTWHQTMPVGLPSAVAQALAGTLTMSGALASVVKFTVTLTGTLTMSGAVSGTYYPPVPDAFLTTLFRRNQTD